ncbi:MAG: hypothetical protein OER96_05470, partial [Gammaproteobacteria bacterium]|nr:hypothetical protein [Gammaproteobacteria bacterium]
MTAGTPIWFCATGKSGLGHLRRVTNIASAIKFNTPRRPLALMTNAPVAGLSEREQSCFSEIKITSRDAMSRELQESKTGPIVVDTAVLPGLAEIDVPLCLILREIKTSKLERFRLAKNRMWDLVIVPNPVDQWQPDTTVLPARRVENVGWIFRTEVGKDNVNPTHSESYNQSIAKILVASGGGGSTDTQYKFCETVTCLIEAVQQRTESLFKVTQAIGPRADDRAVIAGVDEIVKPGSTLNKMFAQADIVISTA